jgi:hypothetical protein
LWNYHFGRGIVATPSDFGKQGRSPTHPELLDYLANQFTESGWSIKPMQRRIVLSHIYQTASQQESSASAADPTLIDPANELLWHFPRRRLDAESIRDGILACADQLDRSPGGAHPFPKQTEWDFTQHKPFRAVYETNRRSVYLMTQRIQRHPYLAIFDGPDTSASTSMRLASTTTLQALYLLNDEFVHTHAQHLANRLLRERSEDRERVQLAFILLLGREPADTEYATAFAHLKEMKILKSGEKLSDTEEASRRAWTSLARTMLRLNEFVYLD